MVRLLTISKTIVVLSTRNDRCILRSKGQDGNEDLGSSPRLRSLHQVQKSRQRELEGVFLEDQEVVEQDELNRSLRKETLGLSNLQDERQPNRGGKPLKGWRLLRKLPKEVAELTAAEGQQTRGMGPHGARGSRTLKRQSTRDVLFHSLNLGRRDSKPSLLRRYVSEQTSERSSPVETLSTLERLARDRAQRGQKALEKFRKVVKTVLLLRKAFGKIREKPKEKDWKFLSWTVIYDDLGLSRRAFDHQGLTFDPTLFKANREIHLSPEAQATLSKPPEERSSEQLSLALASLMTTVQAFGEFPIKMRRSLVKVGWYEHFEAGRVIIRQGHYAENFYFILSGTAVVTILETNKQTGEQYVRTANILKKGNSFGELALMYGAKRSATVTVRDDVELFAVGRQDYVDIFMPPMRGQEPDHFHFLRSVAVLKDWPLHLLPANNPRICVFTYVRRGVLLCRDSNESPWIYVIVSGTCRVLKAMKSPSSGLHLGRPSLNASRVSLLASGACLNASSPTSSPRRQVQCSLPAPAGQAAVRNMGAKCARPPRLPSLHEAPTPAPLSQSRTRRVGVSHSVTSLPPIQERVQQHMSPAELEHRRLLEDIFYKRHVLPAILSEDPGLEDGSLSEDGQSLKGDNQGEEVFLEITKLIEGDVFGLEQIVLKDLGEITSSSLVSEGAEVILIDKKFFARHLTEDAAKGIRHTIQPLPSEKTLQQKLQDQSDWEAYKRSTISHHYRQRHHQHHIVTLRN